MPLYSHILIPLDFSGPAQESARKAAALARRLGATLTLLHVIDYFPENIPNDWIPAETEDPETYLRERSAHELAKIAARAGSEDSQQVVVVSDHSAATAILEYAEQHPTDLIVLGSHGHGSLSAQLSGSTVDRIMHDTETDVIVVHARKSE